MCRCKINHSNLLARVALPPDRCNADLRCGLHSVPVRNSSCVEHGLSAFVSRHHNKFSSTNLSSGKVMIAREGVRVFV
jgi:hypothetical protein